MKKTKRSRELIIAPWLLKPELIWQRKHNGAVVVLKYQNSNATSKILLLENMSVVISFEHTDFKNVIFEKIHWAHSEDVEVAEVKRPQNPK